MLNLWYFFFLIKLSFTIRKALRCKNQTHW